MRKQMTHSMFHRSYLSPSLLLASLLTGCHLLMEEPQEFVIAARGEKAPCAIVLAEESHPSVRYAADELKKYVCATTGVELPLASSSSRKIVVRLRPGTASRGEADAFDIRFEDHGRTLVIEGGGPRGCIYGVYELLERFAGVRFYSSWCEKVPTLDRLSISREGWSDIHEAPAFEMRQPLWYDISRHHEFAAKLRVNGYNYAPDPKIPEALGGDSYRFGAKLKSCHTFNLLCNPKDYFADHPEYFSLVNGVRKGEHTQLCLSNPEVLEVVTSNLFERIRSDPGAKFYGVSQNDWYDYCECDSCAAIDAEEDSHAGTLVRFINALAERVEREFPGTLVETLAYQYTRKPPKKTRLRHNVVPCLCTIELDFARPIPESPFPDNQAFMEDITGWGQQTDQLYVWDYVTQFRHYPHAFANVHALQGNIRFFRDNGVKMLFELGAREGHHAGFAELKGWLLAKWMWNPELDRETLLTDFFDGYYGPAAPFVRTYFDELHRRQLEVSADPARPLRIFDPVTLPPYDDVTFIRWCEELWTKAEEAVRDDALFSYNVRMGHFSHRYTRLELMRAKSSLEDLKNDPEAVALARQLLTDKANARGPMQVVEWDEKPTISAWRAIAGLPDKD